MNVTNYKLSFIKLLLKKVKENSDASEIKKKRFRLIILLIM